jgi:hypothetical protein
MGNVVAIQSQSLKSGLAPVPPAAFAGGAGFSTTELGRRSTPESSIRAALRGMWVDHTLRATILDLRAMDRADGRVKKIHSRLARDVVRGGLMLSMPKPNKRIEKLWHDYVTRLQLDNAQKLKSDARGLIMEGSLPMQLVLDGEGPGARHVISCVRMPTETIKPLVNENGRFLSPARAYEQLDPLTGKVLAGFPLWQLMVARLDPENFDDHGCLGRPYLDASRTVWRKLDMTETDLVIRRRERAPLRTAHVLKGATKEQLQEYKATVEDDQKDITTNYYLNREGGVTPVQGDANLDQIADVAHLLDTFFAGSPAPKGLFGYVGDLSRDILEDIKRDYYDEVDNTQDTLAWLYACGFRLELLLQDINPEAYEFEIKFAERRTETPNQAADRALKFQALGASRTTVFETAGLNPADEQTRLDEQSDDLDPYGVDNGDDDGVPSRGKPKVSVTPGNRRKGESATDISN